MSAEPRPGRRRIILFVAVGLALSLLCVAVVFDPVAVATDAMGVVRVRLELLRARDRWASAAPAGYRIHVRGAIPLSCLVDAELTVRDGALSEVRARQNPLMAESPLVEVSQDQGSAAGCSYKDLTIEAMFDRVEAALKGTGGLVAPLEVRFDPEWGFITEYRYGTASQSGILGPSVSECCTWLEFDRFAKISR